MAFKIRHIHPDITQYVYPLYRPASFYHLFFFHMLFTSLGLFIPLLWGGTRVGVLIS